jgi:hypothetical protein
VDRSVTVSCRKRSALEVPASRLRRAPCACTVERIDHLMGERWHRASASASRPRLERRTMLLGVAALGLTACGPPAVAPLEPVAPAVAGRSAAGSAADAGAPAAGTAGACSVPTRQGIPEAVLQAGPPEALTSGLQRCAEQNAPAGARLSAQFTVGASGCVEGVKVSATPPNPALESCVGPLFGALRFQTPEAGGVEVVRFPVTLMPRRKPSATP